MQTSLSANHSWRQLLAAPAPASHIVQLYDHDAFLETAVAHFAAEGLQRGEAVLLTGTDTHLEAICRRLGAEGVDASAAARSGQLALSDVHEAIGLIAPQGQLDEPRFTAATRDAIAQTLGERRFAGLRWWGEITNTLYHRGHAEAGFRAEELGDAAAKELGFTIFCSFLCDRFNPQAYDGALHTVCCQHSHVIPADDYGHHRIAVNRAIGEVVGDLRGTLLQSLASWKGVPFEAPSSQALLFWVRDELPQHFDAVLERTREHLHGVAA